MAAQEMSHAAWLPEAYAVYALNGKNRVLIGEERTFLDAFHRAADFLDARDPCRNGAIDSLEIVERRDRRDEVVWRYTADEPPPAFDPIARWGFVHWEGPPRRVV
jgi:hypothetical protein